MEGAKGGLPSFDIQGLVAAMKRLLHFSDYSDIKEKFQDYVNLVEFLISSRHLPPHIGIA